MLESYGGLGVKHVPVKPATVIEPFKLSSGVYHQDSSTVLDLPTEFHARPAPKGILEGVVVSALVFAFLHTILCFVVCFLLFFYVVHQFAKVSRYIPSNVT